MPNNPSPISFGIIIFPKTGILEIINVLKAELTPFFIRK